MIYVFIKKRYEHIETSTNMDAFFSRRIFVVSRSEFSQISLSPSYTQYNFKRFRDEKRKQQQEQQQQQ